MFWLNIFTNETLLLVAETLLIVTGSMLVGILLSHMYWGGMKKKISGLESLLESERQQNLQWRQQLEALADERTRLEREQFHMNAKIETQAKTIYDQTQYILSIENDHQLQKNTLEELKSSTEQYENRLQVITRELEQTQSKDKKLVKPVTVPAARANYDQVSQLLGRQVTENDLTIVYGIGPKTAALLHQQGINTWDELAVTKETQFRQWLDEAGGIYKTLQPEDWSKQALMAARGEWRKLRLFQERLKKPAT